MGQTFTAGSIAAIMAVLVAVALIIAFVLIIPKKNNYGTRYDVAKTNKPLKNGATARIMCMATGRYLRRRTDVECLSAELSATQTLVTADATRAEATLWKMAVCSSCPDSRIPFGPGTDKDWPVDGRWSFYDAVGDNESHFLTFVKYDIFINIPLRIYNGARTELFNVSEPYYKGSTDLLGNPVGPPAENYIDSNFWFDLDILPIALSNGPNGAFLMNVEGYIGGRDTLTSHYANGAYNNGLYDPITNPTPASVWTEETCFQPKGVDLDETTQTSLTKSPAVKTYFIEVL